MAENVNFIAAKDLPVTDANEVDVLCVENGELKRKAGASLGGSSGGGYIIKLAESDLIEPNEDGQVQITITESYDNFADILYNGGSVWVSIPIEGGITAQVPVTMWAYAEGFGFILTIKEELMLKVFVIINCPNGTWTPPEA